MGSAVDEQTQKPDFRMVQRPTTDLPILHLEAEIPSSENRSITIDGLVSNSATWSIDEIHAMKPEQRVWDLNCVWGWVRPDCGWEGIPAAQLIDAAEPVPEATHVMARAVNDAYESCLTIEEARESLLAWRLEGEDLTPEHGWPLRLVTTPGKWGYKGIKWIERLTFIDGFTPGFWEGLVGKPHGDIPEELLDHRFE